jgi:hypothetical protein
MGMQGKYMGKIIHGKDSTSDTWKGKDSTGIIHGKTLRCSE